MKKYIKLFTNYLTTAYEYRANLIGTIILEAVILIAGIIFYLSLFQNDQSLSSLSKQQTLLYFILIPLVGFISQVYASESLAQAIRYGSFSNNLLKPYKTWIAVFVEALAKKLNTLLLILPVYFVIIVYLYQRGFLYGVDKDNLFLGIIFSVAAFLLHFVMDYAIALTAFWFSNIWSFNHLKIVLFGTLGGTYFPLEFITGLFRKIFDLLPFKFRYYIPVSYVIGNSRSLRTDILSLLIWIGIFLCLSLILWKQGIKRYEAYGN